MDLKIKGKVVVVTGAAGLKGSIGDAIVQGLADEGAIPVIIDIHERGVARAKALRERGMDALFIKTDLTNPAQIEEAAKQVGETYGSIDALINNIGINDGIGLSHSVAEFTQSIQLNLVSFFSMTKFCLPYIKKDTGSILNIGSKVALTGQGNTSAYAAAKGGVLALTREWAVDLIKDGIRSNAIIISESWTPSYAAWINTLDKGDETLKAIKKKIPLGNRMTTPQEIADVCLFTISERSSHTTGQFITVDGGYMHLDRALLTE